MIKTFYEVDIDADFFKELAELLSIKDENHTIYLSSNGGDVWFSSFIDNNSASSLK